MRMSPAKRDLVRAFTQDDAHIFCTEDQVKAESIAFCDLLRSVYKDFGFAEIAVKFSDRPKVRAGSDATWDKAEAALRESGLSLDPQRRDLFESRYLQERRQMERALRHQVETERQQQLPTLIQQLKKEFQLEQPLNASPLPRATGSPKGE